MSYPPTKEEEKTVTMSVTRGVYGAEDNIVNINDGYGVVRLTLLQARALADAMPGILAAKRTSFSVTDVRVTMRE